MTFITNKAKKLRTQSTHAKSKRKKNEPTTATKKQQPIHPFSQIFTVNTPIYATLPRICLLPLFYPLLLTLDHIYTRPSAYAPKQEASE